MAGEPPAMVETMPVADETPAVSAPTAPTEEAMPPEKSRPKQEPAAKAAVPPRAKAAPEAPKPVEPEPDPHAGHGLDKKSGQCTGRAWRPGARGPHAELFQHTPP